MAEATKKGGRARKGTVLTLRDGRFQPVITLDDGTRKRLPPLPLGTTKARALETAAAFSERASALGLVTVRAEPTKPAGESVAGFVDLWLADRARRGLSSIATDRGRLTGYVLPIVGGAPIVSVSRDEVRAVVEHLDERVRAGAISWRTAVKAWGLVTKIFADACDSKTAALRVRANNPTIGLPGPDRGEQKGRQWLYPSEVTALLACEAVPARWCQLYALAAYLYLRPGELAALDWASVNLEAGHVHVHTALDLRSGDLKATKTKHTRRVPIPLALRPLLEAMHRAAGGTGPVVSHLAPRKKAAHGFPPIEDLAATLRDHLARAGVTRAELFRDGRTTKRVTFYDLRATGITWEALDGTEPLKIMQRAGHVAFTTTTIYIREAEAIGKAVGAPFPSLPEAVFRSVETISEGPERRSSQFRAARLASPTGFEPVLQP